MQVSFAEGAVLYRQGDEARGAYSLTSGMVALEHVDEEGASSILRFVSAGAFFPCGDLFGQGVHVASARAVTAVSACFIPSDRIVAALADPKVRVSLMRSGCDEAHENERIMMRLSSTDLTERLLALLAEFGDGKKADATVLVPVPWRDIAGMIGTSPEVLSRLLRRLGELRRITVEGRKVTIHERDAEDGPIRLGG